MDRKTILIITSHFPPQLEIAAIRLKSIIKYLRRMDWDVYVLTSSEIELNVISKIIEPSNFIGNENKINLLRSKFKSEKGSIRTNNFPNEYNKLNKQIFKGCLKVLYKILSVSSWSITSYVKARKLIKEKNITKVLCTVPTLDVLVLGAFIKAMNPKIELIEEIRDLMFSNGIYNSELTSLEQSYNYYLEKKSMKYVDKFIYLTENIKNKYYDEFKYELRDKKFEVITNGFDSDDYVKSVYTKKDKLVISHFGSFYGTRSPVEFIKATGELIRNENMNINVNLVGKFQGISVEEEVQKIIEEYNISEYVQLIPRMEHTEVIRLEQESDVNLIITHTNNQSDYALPGKLFEYIGAMRPILSISNDELLCDAMDKYQLGYNVKDNTKESIKDELKKIYKDWMMNSLSTSQDVERFNMFNRSELTKRLDNFLQKSELNVM
ncbi:glycosyltransferase [Paenibacillus planticolens]|uniref:Glycosyltransferase n=1 Tax=Paenibacillus planticolens TaxID=2654976 RepID=A0ABX1ZIV7_9BACL|nr:glycosyltransferase [Paenibacillus planticolens]NOV00010.1 glycosyltransferase [Paenibacillus planticolens]